MLLALTAVLLSADPKLGVAPHCSLVPGQLSAHVAITTTWRGADGVSQNDGDKLYSFTCEVKSKQCRGARINLEPERGRLSFGDVLLMQYATLKSIAGQVAIVEWGVHQFVIDLDAGTVTKTATQSNGAPEKGVGRCK